MSDQRSEGSVTSIAERLRGGAIVRPNRWSGDTHADVGGPIDESATNALMAAGADEIDRLTKERDAMREALRQCHAALVVLTEPESIKTTTVHTAWGMAVAAELIARRTLNTAAQAQGE